MLFFVLYTLAFRYEIMRKCWKVEPEERPTFEQVHKSLSNMLNDDDEVSKILQKTFV